MSKLCIFGEVLFDQFPDGQSILGGAPSNVAWHLHAFGLAPLFVSAVGNDTAGDTIIQSMQQWGMDSSSVVRNDHASGIVDIQLVDDEPEYDIVSPSAWDFITASQVSDEFSWLYHGSLSLRHAHNQQTLNQLLQATSNVFLDVNLRDPWWNKQPLLNMIERCDWLKLNIDELNLLYPSSESTLIRLQQLIDHNQLQGIVLTRGAEGAEIMTRAHDWHEVTPDETINIVDTVGAGDAFTSVFITGLIKRWPVAITVQRAQTFASAIVEQRGATVSDRSFYQSFIQQWALEQ